LRAREREIVPAQGHEFRAVVELVRAGEGFVSILDVDRVVGDADV
jgi:hypothetical protein